jgi:hypothetical protein
MKHTKSKSDRTIEFLYAIILYHNKNSISRNGGNFYGLKDI